MALVEAASAVVLLEDPEVEALRPKLLRFLEQGCSDAAVLLGGTSFLGGVGGVTGTAVGVLFIATLQNGLSISGVSSFWQQVVTGVILILAIAIDMLQQSPGGRLRRLRGVGHGPTSTSEPTLEEGQPR